MGTFYAPNDYRNYIAHYGVKGMKWGVRKDRNSDSAGHRFSRKAGQIKKNIGRSVRDFMADADQVKVLQRKKLAVNAPIDTEIDQILRGRAAKNLSGIVSEYWGAGATRTAYENRARYHEGMAKTYTGERRRREQERQARNARSLADAYDKSAQIYAKGGKAAMKRRIRNALQINPEVWSATYERKNGKKITQGRHMMEEAAKKAAIELAKQYIRNKYSRR